MFKTETTFAFLSLVLLTGAVGCATAPPPPPSAITMTCRYPVFSPLPQTKELQRKGGVSVTLAVAPFQCVQQVEKTYAHKGPTLAETALGRKNGHRVTTSTPRLVPAPERLKVTLRVTNHIEHVVRGAGTLIQFQIAGKNYAAKAEDFAEFTNMILPPHGEQTVDLYGPQVDTLPPQATLAIIISDLVTKTDDAGNPTSRDHFEWFYNYEMQAKAEAGQVVVEEN
jgi:hypothetical protein